MSNQDVLSAIDTYLKRNQALDTVQGQIQTITGATALVRVTGSNRVQEAYYSKGANLSPGDQCILVRTNRNSRWIVMGGYSTSYTGHNDTTPPSSASSGSQGVVTNIKTASTGMFTLAATYQTCTTLSISTGGGPVLVGVTGIFVNNSTTAATTGFVDAALDGTVITGAMTYAVLCSIPLGSSANASFTLLFTNIAAGDHTVALKAHYGAPGTTLSYYLTSFWAIEL